MYIYILLYIYIFIIHRKPVFQRKNNRNQVLCWENWVGTCPTPCMYVSKVLDLLTGQILIIITIIFNEPSPKLVDKPN